jgi:hypothetical protein
VQQWANAKGAHTSHQGKGLFCTRATQPAAFKKFTEKTRLNKNIPLERQREKKSMRCGCKFVIKFSRATAFAIKGGVSPLSVRITDGSHYRHTGGCFPCQSQLIVDKKSSGSYQDSLKGTALKAIIAVLKPGKPVSCLLMREMMRPLYPLSIAITSQNVWNMRLKVKKLILLEEEQNVDGTSTSQVLVSSSSIQEENELPSLDEIPAEFLPVASQIAREILKQALNSGNDTKVILAYLQKLHASDPTFTFRIAYATDGSISGYVWQTAAMRADWEDYGNVLFLDAMKRQLNSVHWRYIGPCVLDGYKKVCVVAEAICVSELIDGYAWIVEMLANMGPRRALSRVFIIFGDGIFAGGSLPKKTWH